MFLDLPRRFLQDPLLHGVGSTFQFPLGETFRVCLRFVSIRTIVAVALFSLPAFSQRTVVDPYNSYFRIYAVVPVVGSGSSADPTHPLYAPNPTEINPNTGILGFTSVLSDDGKYALIEIVARQRSAYAKLLGDSSIVSFEKGRVPPSTIQAAFARYKPSFQFSQFGEVPVR